MTDTAVKKPRATKTPRSYDSILKGALSLELKDRVAMVHALKDSNTRELETKAKEFEQAKQIVNGS